LAEIQKAIVATEDVALLQEAGVCKYRHPLSDAVAYEQKLAAIQAPITATRGNMEARSRYDELDRQRSRRICVPRYRLGAHKPARPCLRCGRDQCRPESGWRPRENDGCCL
jgi:hypothetical protein